MIHINKDTIYQKYDEYVQIWIKESDDLDCDLLCNYCREYEDCEDRLMTLDMFRDEYENANSWRD